MTVFDFYKERSSLQEIISQKERELTTQAIHIHEMYQFLTSLLNIVRSVKNGESEIIMRNGGKIWEITKNYNEEEFTSDELSIGIPIDVYQESINKSFKVFSYYRYMT